MILTHGVLDALNLAIRAVTKPGSTVIVETPTYFNLYPLFESLSVNCLEITTHPLTGMDLDELETTLQQIPIAAIITIPTVHNQHCLRLTCCFEMSEQYRKGLIRLGQLACEMRSSNDD